ncbi:MAG: pentapeptide repeat-containing protein [Elainellaceae cyanobacterium]
MSSPPSNPSSSSPPAENSPDSGSPQPHATEPQNQSALGQIPSPNLSPDDPLTANLAESFAQVSTQHTADLAQLRQEFDELCQMSDLLEQRYQLLQRAKASKLPSEDYCALFEEYRSLYSRHTDAAHEQLLLQLNKEFAKIASTRDPIERNYRLIQRAKASEIDTDEYRELFQEFERKQAKGVRAVLGTLWRGTKTLGTILGSLTIFWGIVLFILEADSRQQEAHTQAWQIITGNKGSTESAGRIQALQTLAEGCRPLDAESQSEFIDAQVFRLNFLSQVSYVLNPDKVSWRELPVIGGFFPDCVSLRGLDITNAHLPELDLPWADLRNARMQDTKLWSANLQGAQLQGSQLQRSRLRNASLQGANFEGATLEEADLAGASFYCTPDQAFYGWFQLGLTRRSECLLPASFSKANLSRANLRGGQETSPTHFGRALLTDVELNGALYDTRTLIEVCRLEKDGSSENNANFEVECRQVNSMSIPAFLEAQSNPDSPYQCAVSTNGESTIWSTAACDEIGRAFEKAYAIVPGEDLTNINLNRAELSEANLEQSQLTGSSLQGAKLRQAQLNGANLTEANLSCDRIEVGAGVGAGKNPVNTLLSCTDLRDAQLQDAMLNRTRLMGANLAEANLESASLVAANLSCAFPDAALRRCTDLSDANLRSANLQDANLTGTNLEGADLFGATGWTAEQIRTATNWSRARYDDNQRQALGL